MTIRGKLLQFFNVMLANRKGRRAEYWKSDLCQQKKASVALDLRA